MILGNVGWGIPIMWMGFYNPFYSDLFPEADTVGFNLGMTWALLVEGIVSFNFLFVRFLFLKMYNISINMDQQRLWNSWEKK